VIPFFGPGGQNPRCASGITSRSLPRGSWWDVSVAIISGVTFLFGIHGFTMLTSLDMKNAMILMLPRSTTYGGGSENKSGVWG
jgi:hypothetical protein